MGAVKDEQNSYQAQFERLELALEAAGLGAWDWWIQTNKVSYDQRWARMLGLDAADLPQEFSTWESRVHPEDLERCRHDLTAYMEGRTQIYENIHRLRHVDGNWVWILVRGNITERDEAGLPTRFTGTHFDVSEYKEEEILNREVQSIAKIGGWELEVETQKTFWTDETYRIHKIPVGTPTNKIMGVDFFLSEYRSVIVNHVTLCMQGVPFSDTLGFVDAEGNHKWVALTGEPLFNADGKVYRLRGTIQDVSKRVSSQKQLEGILKNSPGAVYQFKMEPSGKTYFTFASERTFSFYEITPDDFKNNPNVMTEMVHPEDQGDLLEKIQASFKNMTHFEWEGRLISKSGQIKWIDAKSGPQKQLDGSVVWDGIMMDVTIRHLMEEKLKQQRVMNIQASKMASLGELSAGIAHEINNPLAIVSGSLELLKKESNLSASGLANLERVNRALSRITKIIGGLRKFSRLSRSEFSDNQNLGDVVSEAMTLISSKFKSLDIQFTSEIETKLGVCCDPIEVEQVLINLLNNAIDAAKSSSGKWVRLRIWDAPAEAAVYVSVTDSGPGLSPELEEKVFEPFFTTKPVGEGTGLGLSVSKGILDAHGATLKLDRSQTHTCFLIRFPQVR